MTDAPPALRLQYSAIAVLAADTAFGVVRAFRTSTTPEFGYNPRGSEARNPMIGALRKRLFGLTLLITPVVAIAQQAPDPLFGTRTLNLAKSTLPASWALRSVVLTYEAAGNALKATWTGRRADGTVSTIRFAAKFDG
jgi:hypothetical protein